MAPDRRAIHHRSIFQVHQPAFWVFAVFLAYGVVRMVTALGQLASVSRSGWALSWLLLLAYAAPLVILIYYLDLYEREPVSVAIAAFLWGAFAATALALDAAGWDEVLANVTTPGFAVRWGPSLTAPVIEEFLKGAGLVLLYLIVRDEVDDMMDGFVYGALCGLGFAVVEDVVYFMAGFGGTPSGVLEGFYVRVVSSGLYGHVLYTGLVGMAIGLLVTRRDPTPVRERLPLAVGIIALAVLGHALWNAPVLALAPSPPVHGAAWLLYPVDLAIKGLPLLLFVIVALRLARARERRWLDGALDGEVGLGGVTAEELAILRVPARRRAAVRTMRTRAGDVAGRLLSRLQREQIDLAMVASRVTAAEAPELVAQRAYCVSLRAALDAIPGAVAASQSGG